MNIKALTPNKINSFKGQKEAEFFRKEAHSVLSGIDKMNTIVEYTEKKQDGKTILPSIQERIKRLLFFDVSTVGEENAGKEERTLLSELKKSYVALEKEYTFYNSFQNGTIHSIDRTGEVIDIKF